jgi:hypothetical protein
MSRSKTKLIGVSVLIVTAAVGVWSAPSSPSGFGVLVLEEGSTEFRLTGDG